MNGQYILVGHEPKPIDDLLEWASAMETSNRHVAKTEIGDVAVSTVFLGLDHNYSKQGPPILFETIIFGGEHDQYQERYSTWDEAVIGHETAVKLVKK